MSSMMVQRRSPYRFLGQRLIEPNQSSACGSFFACCQRARACASHYRPILTIASGLAALVKFPIGNMHGLTMSC
jgi:hypothetical protein